VHVRDGAERVAEPSGSWRRMNAPAKTSPTTLTLLPSNEAASLPRVAKSTRGADALGFAEADALGPPAGLGSLVADALTVSCTGVGAAVRVAAVCGSHAAAAAIIDPHTAQTTTDQTFMLSTSRAAVNSAGWSVYASDSESI